MNSTLSKWSLLSLASTLCIANLHSFAGVSGKYDETQAEINAIAVQNVEGQWMGKNPSYPLPDDTSNVTLFGDFLYMRAEQSGLQYAQTTHNKTNNIILNGHLLDIDFDWKPGVRAGLGYTFASDNWDLLLTWTYLQSHTTSSASAPTDGFLYAIWAPYANGASVQHASAKWNLNYNVADLELGRAYFVSHALSFRPFFGVRGAWLNQDMHFKYSGFSAPSPQKTKATNDFSGVGLRSGFNLGWHFNSQWNLQSYVSGSLLWGRFKEKMKTTQSVAIVSPLIVTDPLSESYTLKHITTNLQIGLVLEWGMNFNDDKSRVEVSAGYEFTDWFEQNQLYKIPVPDVVTELALPAKGNLSLQGATGTVRFYF